MDTKEFFTKYCDAADPHLNWNKGNRHFALVALATNANKAGFDENIVTDECVNRYAESDFDEKEIRETVSDIYRRYSSDHGINQKVFTPKTDKKTKGQIDTSKEREEDLFDEDELLTAKYPDVEEVRKYIPSTFYDYIIDSKRSKEVQFTTLMSVLVAMGAMMKGVKCLMKWGEVVTTFLYYFVCGAAATGKSCINKGHDFFKIHADIIQNKSKEEVRKKKEEYRKWVKCQKNCKEEDCGCGAEPIIPKPVKILFTLSISESRLKHQLFDNGEIPILLFTSELDSFLNVKDNSLLPVLRAGYEGETISNHTHMHGDVTVDNPQISIITSGTPQQYVTFFQHIETGLPSRVLFNALPVSTYEGLTNESNLDYNTYMDIKKAFKERAKTFIQYAINLELNLNLTTNSRYIIDAYYINAEKRYAHFINPDLLSFIRRLRKMNIRLAMILTVLGLYDEDQTPRSYDIPDDIIKLMISWNDFWIEQHIRLISLFPEEAGKTASNTIKYAHVYDSLPCEFDFCSAKTIFEKKVGKSSKTAQRALKDWVKAGLLTHKLQRYYRTDCPDCPPQEKTSMC